MNKTEPRYNQGQRTVNDTINVNNHSRNYRHMHNNQCFAALTQVYLVQTIPDKRHPMRINIRLQGHASNSENAGPSA